MPPPNPAALDFNNVQGDILVGGLPKRTQTFFFFQINKDRVQDFRTQLVQLAPLITTTAQVIKDRAKIDENKKQAADSNAKPDLVKLVGVNIAFSHKGLVQLGINDKTGDDAFEAGMLAGAETLGDPGTKPTPTTFDPKWDPAFKKDIHGVILITGDHRDTVRAKLAEIKKILPTAQEVKSVIGDVRQGKDEDGLDQKGHEHFGFADGISEPAVQGVTVKTNRGQETVRQGIILLGRDGDTVERPSWALDGSFLSFRYLSQLVPEFNEFLKASTKNGFAGLPPKEGADLLGARLVGRWKSGAPIDVTPTEDDVKLGRDPTRNNDFSFNHVFPDDQKTQDRCPFAAHVRKTNPRADLNSFGGTEIRRIVRSGIPFGPEVTRAEKANGKSDPKQDRGLLFVAYQSNIGNGFKFIQEQWANKPTFPPKFPPTSPVQPGFDPLIGQTNNPKDFVITGVDPDPNKQADPLTLTAQWVVPKGGEYFFTPSLPALRKTFALPASGKSEL